MSLLEKLIALRQPVEERNAFLTRVGAVVCEPDRQRIERLERLVAEVTEAMEMHRDSSRKLRRILFGPKTEKTEIICRPATSSVPSDFAKPKRKGHGRRGHRQYTGAKRIPVAHPTLKAGQCCPGCSQGHIRLQGQPSVVLQVEAAPPITAKAYEKESLRCDTCGKVYTAPTPREAGVSKYADNVGVMVGFLRFGNGIPHYRLAKMQANLGMPLPEGTQYGLMKSTAPVLELVFEALVGQVAQSPLLHNDDTTMRIQGLRKTGSASAAEIDPKRTGTFTTSIVGQDGPHTVVLFFTGWKHAGENLAQVLRHRSPELEPPMQMCDALSRNLPKGVATLEANCNSHARREFVDIHSAFPQECRRVLEAFREVYRFDAEAKEQAMNAEQRLDHHQKHSAPVMSALKQWLEEQKAQKRVEPNSGLGQANDYLLGHWEALTLFLRRAGAPLDNNICERALKMAIQHRKNSLSYKTVEGARVGDLFMSIIHTCQLNGIHAYEYLLALVRNVGSVKLNPKAWLPWNYPRGQPQTQVITQLTA